MRQNLKLKCLLNLAGDRVCIENFLSKSCRLNENTRCNVLVNFPHKICILQGMGKYFVSLARETGYERTLLQLGRRVR
jgi:hypothetical protein